MKRSDLTVNGFRSSFRDWTADRLREEVERVIGKPGAVFEGPRVDRGHETEGEEVLK
jgi:hypothetical protein